MDLPLHQQSPNLSLGFKLDEESLISIKYHNLFGFGMNWGELARWRVGKKASNVGCQSASWRANVKYKGGYYFLEENKGAVLKRVLRKRTSLVKMEIAKRAAKILGKVPTVKMVGVTGSLAMENADEDSDIDLIIVTTQGGLWKTRLISYFVLKLARFKLRKPRETNEKDKLCLNMWMDENDLGIERKNIYTAHEILQIVPLVNKRNTYERFLLENIWAAEYWPNAMPRIKNGELGIKNNTKNLSFVNRFIERGAFGIQYWYMIGKLTRERVTATRAFFHPYDWGEYIRQNGF